jgi:integrase
VPNFSRANFRVVRPAELRAAYWSEFDFERAEWRIPAERMKMGEMHIVLLAPQAVDILRAIQPLTGSARFVFRSPRTVTHPISKVAVNAALRRLGFSKEDMTGHGFRTMASTLLNEQGWHPGLIELQLGHAKRNKVRSGHRGIKAARAQYEAWRAMSESAQWKTPQDVKNAHPQGELSQKRSGGL